MMSVAEQVRALIAKQLEVEEGKVVPEASLIDDLQAVIQALKTKDFGVPIQVENYR